MAKVSKKSEKITAFGGIFFVLDKFDRILSSVIDSHLGLRSKLTQKGRFFLCTFQIFLIMPSLTPVNLLIWRILAPKSLAIRMMSLR